jgi:hypothetical protein
MNLGRRTDFRISKEKSNKKNAAGNSEFKLFTSSKIKYLLASQANKIDITCAAQAGTKIIKERNHKESMPPKEYNRLIFFAAKRRAGENSMPLE